MKFSHYLDGLHAENASIVTFNPSKLRSKSTGSVAKSRCQAMVPDHIFSSVNKTIVLLMGVMSWVMIRETLTVPMMTL